MAVLLSNRSYGTRNILIILFLVICARVSAKIVKVAVVVRIPPYGPFTRTDFDDDSTRAITTLSDDETTWAINCGKRLRELYIRSSRVIPPRYEKDVVDLLSMETVRTSQAAQLLGIGLYDRGGDRKPIELPPARKASSFEELLLSPCIPPEDSDKIEENSHRHISLKAEKATFWSDFKRSFRVRNDDRLHIQDNDLQDWIFESAYETLSRGHLDDNLLNRLKVLGASVFHRNWHPSKVFQEIMYGHFERRRNRVGPEMYIYVLDDSQVMSDLVQSAIFSLDGTAGFPLPRVLSFELHDESELDPTSKVRFIRILQDFVPSTCDEQGNFICEMNSFLESPRRSALSDSEWRMKCSLGAPTGEPTSTVIVESAAKEGAGNTVDSEKVAVHGPSGLEQTSTLNPTPCLPQSSSEDNEDEFIHGFLWGLALVTTAFACRCSPRNNPQDEMRFGTPNEANSALVDRSGGIEDGMISADDDSANEPGTKSPHSFMLNQSGPHIPPAAISRPSVIAHIPRPKPLITGSNSPAIGRRIGMDIVPTNLDNNNNGGHDL